MIETVVKHRREHLMVVEDDEFSQKLIELYLRKSGFTELTVASDGRQALDIVRSRPFDLILLDLNLPRISGVEVLRRLKKTESLNDTPVIVISSITNMEDIVQCLDLGASDYLPKPFNVRLLEARVTGALETRRLRREVQDQATATAAAVRAVGRALSRLSLPPTGGAADAAALTLGGEGDFHDVFTGPDGSAWFCLGTALGGGLPALHGATRLLAAVHGAVSASEPGQPPAPGAVLAAANAELYLGGPTAGLSALLGVIQAGAGPVRLASAAHPDPVLITDGSVASVAVPRGPVLGASAEADFIVFEHDFTAQDRLIMVTAGLGQAMNERGEYFHLTGWEAGTAAVPERAPIQIVDAVAAAFRRHVGSATVVDAATILAVGRRVKG